MPKKVDHEARRTRIAEALWRVATVRGLDKMGLRDVAAEAEMSLGQLQHYFGSRDELLMFAMEFLRKQNIERVARRIASSGSPTPGARLRAIVREMLPVDDKAEAGSLMNLIFLLESVRSSDLREHAHGQALALRELLEWQITLAIEHGEITSAHEPRRAAAHLAALADGLRVGFHLGLHSPAEAIAVMDDHLDRLLG